MHFVPINYSDPAFDAAFTADFQLLVILNEQSFSFAIRQLSTQKLVRLSTGNNLGELFSTQSHPELNSTYQKVTIAVETPSFCLIPDAVFTPENLLDFATFLVVKEADVILTDQIEQGQNTIIFTFPEDLVHRLEKHFHSPKIHFAQKGWIKMMIQSPLSGQNLYLFLEENVLQVLFPDKDNIRFYNQFSYATADELVYYTALVAEQLKLKPEETELIICGRVEADGEQMLRLRQFFKDVSVFTTPYFKQRNVLQQHQIVQFSGLN